MFTANSSKNAQSYCQPTKESMCFNLPLHTHDEDHFHHPQTLKLAFGTHTDGILNRDKKHKGNLSKNSKTKTFKKREYSFPNKFTPPTNLNIGTFVLLPSFVVQKRISKSYNQSQKDNFRLLTNPLM